MHKEILPHFGICCRELGGSKLNMFMYANAVSVLSIRIQMPSRLINT